MITAGRTFHAHDFKSEFPALSIPLNRPLEPDRVKLADMLGKVVDRGWYSNFGPLEQRLTERLREYLGVENLLLVSNGTVAIQVALRALGVTQGHVATTPFSFVATTSTIVWDGMAPAFVDIDPATLNMNPRNLQRLSGDVSAILPVHVYGNPCEVEALDTIARERAVPLIYDAAHAFGSQYMANSVLQWGDAATLSFHATKLFHTVEGGAIVFRSRDALDRAKSLVNFGLGGEPGLVGAGINAKLSEFHAAMGLVILDQMDQVMSHRAALDDQYRTILAQHVQFQTWNSAGYATGAYAPVLLRDERECLSVAAGLERAGIGSRRYFHPSLNTLPVNSPWSTPCPVAEDAASRVLCLPMHASLTRDDVRQVSQVVIETLDEWRRVD